MGRHASSGAATGTSTPCLALVAATAAWVADEPALAVYAVSFWHYLLYWWAYRYGCVSTQRLRRDALVVKTLSLTAFGWAFAQASPSGWTIALATAGFGLNAAGAWQLGADRTYYGWELGDVPHRRVTGFPYSVVPHPMLIGNMLAFGSALVTPAFRERWWFLSAAHIVLNLGLLRMETRVAPSTDRTAQPAPAGTWALGTRLPFIPVVARALTGGAAGAALAALTASAGGQAVRGWAWAAVGAAMAAHGGRLAAGYLSPSTQRRTTGQPHTSRSNQ